MNKTNSMYVNSAPVNNTIFERKHHFMYILKEAETLKAQISEELIYGSIEASRLDEINSICNLAFAGLIQEGLAYRYERDTNPAKDAFVITVDHTDYRCRAQALKNILKDKFPNVNLDRIPGTKISEAEEVHPLGAPIKERELLFNSSESSVPLHAEEKNITPISAISPTVPVAPIVAAKMEQEKLEKSADSSKEDAEELLNSFMSEVLGKSDATEEPYSAKENFSAFEVQKNAKAETNTETKPQPEPEFTFTPEPTPPPKYEVIGKNPITQSISSVSFFKEEKEKHKSGFVFQTSRVSVRHEGVSRTEEVCFMVAPLEIKKDEITTKIIVYAYLNGRVYTQTSLNNKTPGRNTVTLCAGDYEFLVRGIFNENKFSATITLDGISVRQNDSMNILESTIYEPKTGLAQNGHIKFRFENANKEEELIEVFPIALGKNEFVILRQYGEWVDIFCTEKDRFLANTADGAQELLCMWEGDVLKAEFVPAS